MKRLVLFASGSGSNVENIAKYFEKRDDIIIEAVFTNKRDAYVIDRCNRLNINVIYFNKVAFSGTGFVLDMLRCIDPDLVILAGFLWKIPPEIVSAFQGRIINIHPALLPKFGGKGMYGMNVHKAVKQSLEKESGITIHYVDEHYDEGSIIFQESVGLESTDSPEDIAEKVHRLEYLHYPQIIEQLLASDNG